MELEFPSRLFGDGLEPHVKKINDRWRLGLLELVKEKNEARIRGSGERSLFLAYYGYQEVESEVFGEAGMTSRRHEKWFTFARRPLRFGLKEYHVVTGLKVKQEKNSGLDTWKDDDGFWSTQIKTYENINLQIIKKKYLVERNSWTWVDMARLIYLCVIMGVVMGRDEKVNFPHPFMKLAIVWRSFRITHGSILVRFHAEAD